MRAGPLKNRLAFQGALETTAVNGERSKIWTTRATVWGSVEPLSSRELLTGQQVAPRATHKIVIRGGGVQPSTRERVLFGTRIFHIEGPVMDKDEQGVLVWFLAVEAAP